MESERKVTEKKSKQKKQKTEKKSKHKISVKTITRSIAFKFAVVLFIFLALSFTTLSFFLVHSIAEDNTETYTNFSTTIAERTADGLTYWLDSFSKSFGIFTNSEAFTSGKYFPALYNP